MTLAHHAPRRSPTLPELRGELQLAGYGTRTRGQSGVLFDPIREKYFRLDGTTLSILSIWRECATAAELEQRLREAFDIDVTESEISTLTQFLEFNMLTIAPAEDAWTKLAETERRSRSGWIAWTIHNYLYVRLPLIRPEPYLRPLIPFFAIFITRLAGLVVGFVGLIGIYLVSRQWDVFLHTFSYMYSAEGIITYGVALALVKSLHELGHAITAIRYGCRVPTMGVCFLVMFPMLYTDVTDAWRLSDRRSKLSIDCAGLVVETALAALATFVWAFLPDGPVRSMAFAVATTSFFLTVALNLNPFMRFDGYYILADWLGIDNLQSRAFAIGRWRLREVLFGLDTRPPERMSRQWLHGLALYAYAVWLYRLVVFTGIAVTVYTMAFKALGIVLFAVEIIYFIMIPIWRELKGWYLMRHAIRRGRRTLLTFCVGAMILGIVTVPWSTRIVIPATLEAGEITSLYPVRAGQIVSVSIKNGMLVERGAELFKISSPEVEQEIMTTKLRAKVIELRLERRSIDTLDRADSLILEDTLKSLREKLSGLERELHALTLLAPTDGVVAELDPDLHLGRWIRRTDLVAVIRSAAGDTIRGYVGEDALNRLRLTEPATFVSENPLLPTRTIRLVRISQAGTQTLDSLELTSHYGGPIPVRPQNRSGDGRSFVPISGQYQISGELIDHASGTGNDRTIRGHIIAVARAESLLVRACRQILRVLIRESGS